MIEVLCSCLCFRRFSTGQNFSVGLDSLFICDRSRESATAELSQLQKNQARDFGRKTPPIGTFHCVSLFCILTFVSLYVMLRMQVKTRLNFTCMNIFIFLKKINCMNSCDLFGVLGNLAGLSKTFLIVEIIEIFYFQPRLDFTFY